MGSTLCEPTKGAPNDMTYWSSNPTWSIASGLVSCQKSFASSFFRQIPGTSSGKSIGASPNASSLSCSFPRGVLRTFSCAEDECLRGNPLLSKTQAKWVDVFLCCIVFSDLPAEFRTERSTLIRPGSEHINSSRLLKILCDSLAFLRQFTPDICEILVDEVSIRETAHPLADVVRMLFDSWKYWSKSVQ